MTKLLVVVLAALFSAPVSAQHEHHDAQENERDPRLAEQIEAVRHATERYRDHANASADGYQRFGVDGPLMGEHWYHPELVKKPLDLTRPATLQYATIDGKRVLVGVAYNLYQRPGEALPEGFAGNQDHWHVHDITKLARTLVAERPVLRWIVDRRIEQGKIGAGDNRTQLVMVHAWVWQENPAGMFAQDHRALPYLRAGLPADWATPASTEAAFGVSLLRDGCTREIERVDRLAKLSGAQRRELGIACDRAAAEVRQASASAKSADSLNQPAALAWKKYEETRERVLTPDQKKRLAAVIEPMMAH